MNEQTLGGQLVLIDKHNCRTVLTADQMPQLRQLCEAAKTEVVRLSLDGSKAKSGGGRKAPALTFIVDGYSNRVTKPQMPRLLEHIDAVERGETREFAPSGFILLSTSRDDVLADAEPRSNKILG